MTNKYFVQNLFPVFETNFLHISCKFTDYFKAGVAGLCYTAATLPSSPFIDKQVLQQIDG
jgi:hypothetical protein